MKHLDSLVKLSIIILCLSLTYKVFTFENNGRYVLENKTDILDTKTGIVTIINKSKRTLHPLSQRNNITGEIRYFLDGKWDNWLKLENKKPKG